MWLYESTKEFYLGRKWLDNLIFSVLKTQVKFTLNYEPV